MAALHIVTIKNMNHPKHLELIARAQFFALASWNEEVRWLVGQAQKNDLSLAERAVLHALQEHGKAKEPEKCFKAAIRFLSKESVDK